MRFNDKIINAGLATPVCRNIKIMQVNLGKKCNLHCIHCHIGAGADRTEVMSKQTIDHCLNALNDHRFSDLDITGGAPELHPHLEYLITSANSLGKRITVRTNLVALTLAENVHLFDIFKNNCVTLVASLPCYGEENVDLQRGQGTYQKSIFALKKLNALGYGIKPQLELNLVYNPNGAFLPGPQAILEAAYKKELYKNWQIRFNHLLTITNVPIGRYLNYLKDSGEYEKYNKLLEDSFNCQTLDNLMCLNQISVAWDGSIYDCDFNQAISLATNAPVTNIKDFVYEDMLGRSIAVGHHCFACTAGQGSSCSGALA